MNFVEKYFHSYLTACANLNILNKSRQYDVCFENRKLGHFYNSPIDNPKKEN